MKRILIISILIISSQMLAQKHLDTIYANEHKNVALFFPEPIRQGIVGAPNFVFTYNREKEQYLGLVQASPGKESNLLVLTKDGRVYSYILKYQKQLDKLNHFVTSSQSIGTERSVMEIPELEKGTAASNKERRAYFERASQYLLGSGHKTMATKRKKGIRIQLQNMVYDDSEVYLVIEVKNNSGINFEIDYLKVYRTNRNPKRKTSYQRLPLMVVHKHKMPYAIIDGKSQRFVYVLPKFVLGDNEKLMLELKELNGSRRVIVSWKK